MRICRRCQKPLPPDAPEGLCPECLARVALGSEPSVPGKRVPPSPAELAAQFPQLEILELLGMGGMGMVYKARQPRLDRLVALKILPIAAMPDASFAERFEREAKALARLNHPGIVTLYDFGQTGEYYYFIMEFVDGMNLRQLIQAKTLEPCQALELVAQICTALQFAHNENIVHRDIKPENILITKKGAVKIADFGLVKLLGSQPDTALTASQMVMGTLNYMAPEQRENAKDVDHRADIYSLGVVFYEMLTGEIPMGRFDAPSKKVQVDVRLDEVVLHALEREPARRYQNVSEVKTNLESISSTMPAATPTPAAPASVQTGIFWLRAYGLFCLGWLLTKFLWNYGSPGCWVACFGLAALAVWISLARMRLFPEQLAIYSKLSKTKAVGKYCALVISFVCLTLGFVFLISAFFNFWDMGDGIHGNYLARSPEQFERQYKGKEFHLLQHLPAFSAEMPTVELNPMGGWTGGWAVGWEERKPGHRYFGVIPNLIVGCYCMLYITFALIGGWRLPGTKLFPFFWRHARASIALFTVILGSALTLFLIAEMAYMTAGSFGSSSTSFVCNTNIDAVTRMVEQWAATNGYAMGDKDDWSISTVPQGKLVAKARLREAWKPSPFDRWRSTGASFRRVSPWLAFELVASENPAETYIDINSAMDCDTEQIANGACHRIPESLVAMFAKMRK